jgi:hypothetical protein
MKHQNLISTLFILVGYSVIVSGQTPGNPDRNQNFLQMDSVLQQGKEYNFIKPLIGSWKVVQTIYSLGGEKILTRDTFKVERKMIGNFLEEIMQPIKTELKPFTRVSYLSYNRANMRWEYIVLDTRYPLMMFETSDIPQVSEDKNIHLYLGAFIVPPFFGKEYNGIFAKQHRVITFKSSDSEINRQYWTLPGGKEFLAIEYDFERK